MIRILFVTEYLGRDRGGERFLLDVFRKLSTRKFAHVTVITGVSHEKVNKSNHLHVVDYNIYDRNLPPSGHPIKSIVNFLSISHSIINRFLQDFDIIHFNNHIPNLLSYFVKLFHKKSTVCSIHHLEAVQDFLEIKNKVGTLVIQDILEVNAICDVIHVPSFHMKEFVGRKRKSKSPIIVIPPGIDLSSYIKLKRKPVEGTFLMIGFLVKRKHYDHALYAWKIISKYNPKAKLYIIGSGPEEKRLKELIRKLGLENSVSLLGYVQEKQKLELLSRAEAMIHLGYPEGFGISIIESLASGVPVIAYDIPPLNEHIINGVNGVLIRKNSIEDLVTTVLNFQKLVFDEKTIRNTAKRYDMEICVKRFTKLYEKLLQ
ncbi:MAG: glycosyltransferase family 4 protein [Candidatus Odinarchaeota archaeon]|nr:glycosyltransferase family 4 protein [Candidatus Odinarchaeota archaeon]